MAVSNEHLSHPFVLTLGLGTWVKVPTNSDANKILILQQNIAVLY